MITTPDLIEALAAGATPVRRLRPPVVRAGGWLLFATALVALIAIAHGVRPDLGSRLQDPVFALGLAASAGTGVLAAIAAFIVSLPDRSRLWALLPLPAAIVWITSSGYGCLIDWVEINEDGVRLGAVVRCFATLLLAGVPLSFSLFFMLRYSARLTATAVTSVGGLAAAAITATGMSLFHQLDATAMVLVWQLGAAALVLVLNMAFGRRALAALSP